MGNAYVIILEGEVRRGVEEHAVSEFGFLALSTEPIAHPQFANWTIVC